ncbi:FAD/NAD(P)-binding protein [Bradyrhizobium sp. 156]|uniref:FAD/NAD(P)-binding protein n=1 Tax=Bradyrhizobium sp. 156 TaxID=2782630 RepID=UPI001FFA1E96|nr:FAD/NAD(P)-binding protein [Bradyrhizobium sp. 156]MCK1326626.1 FAD/NAD(P)-binding protein [Bradyrhizobium sp. 156]
MGQGGERSIRARIGEAAHVLIIGGGQSCRWLLFAFLEHLLRNEGVPAVGQITVIEKRHTIGVGQAWSPDNALPEHLATIPTPLSRSAYGAEQSIQFQRTADALRRVGLRVDLKIDHVATAVRRREEGYEVNTANGQRLVADIVVLAIGASERYVPSRVLTALGLAKGNGIHLSPWPARCLQRAVFETAAPGGRPTGPRVLVLGSYLTAVDAALSLALHAGRFLPERDNSIRFEAHTNFSVVLASRFGQLPKIWRQVASEFPSLAEFGPDWLAQAKRSGDTGSHIPLEAALDLLGPALPISRGLAPLRTRVRAWLARERQCDPVEALRTEIAAASQFSERNGSRLQKPVALTPWGLDEALRVLSEISPYFCAEDQLFFDRSMRTSVFNNLLPMALPTAMQIEALIQSGHLQVIALGQRCKIHESEFASGTYELRRLERHGMASLDTFSDIVDATTKDQGAFADGSALLFSMAQQGLLAQGLRGFRSRDTALRLAALVPDSQVVWAAGAPWWQADGIFVDPQTCAVLHGGRGVVSAGASRLYAMGAMLGNQFVDAQSLGQAHRDASRIATDIFRMQRSGTCPQIPRTNSVGGA